MTVGLVDALPTAGIICPSGLPEGGDGETNLAGP